jgi:hypothetical protein
LKISQKSIESVTFKRGSTQHVQEWADNVQILHYGVRNPGASAGTIQQESVRSLEYAEVFISFDADEARKRNDVVSIIIKRESPRPIMRKAHLSKL